MGIFSHALEKSDLELQKVTLSNPFEEKNNLASKTRPLEIAIAESGKYDAIKVKLATRHSLESLKTFLLTGTSGGSGSTTIAANFAMSLAQDDHVKVLLVDANLRDPKLHEIFNMDYDQVLSCMLTHQDPETTIFKQIKENLYLLANDNRKNGSISVFNSLPVGNFLKAAQQVFSFVILDSPAATDFLDPLLICSKVDGVILVVDAGKTRRHAAIKAKNELQCSGANILGVVLNRRKYYIPDWLYNRL